MLIVRSIAVECVILTLVLSAGSCSTQPDIRATDVFLESEFDTETRWIVIEDDARKGVALRPDLERRISIRAFPETRLIADLTVVPDDQPPGAATRFEIAIEREGASPVLLFSEPLSSTNLGRAWKPISIDLRSTKQEKATLVFRTATVGRGVGPQIALANPVLVSRTASPPKANLILIVVDTLRADRLGAYGHERPTSPFIDELANRGILFERVVAQSSWTKTSVPSMLTSTNPETHGVRRVADRLSGNLPTLAEALRDAGYFTLAVQSNPWLRIESGVARGFMEYAQPGWAGGAAQINEIALDALARRPHRPFFLYLHYMDVHSPYTPTADYRQFGEQPIDLYDSEIRQFDDQLSELFRSLEQRGLLENTLIALTSDHGEEFEEHGGRFHGGALYQEQIRVPWLLTWERRLPANQRHASLVRSLDLAPTLLSLLEITIPSTFQGVPLLDSAGKTREYLEDLPAFSQVGLNDVAPTLDLLSLSTSRWKLIIDRNSDRRELYDLLDDPSERVDLSSTDGATLAELQRTITEFLEHSNAVAIELEPRLSPETEERLRSLGYLK